MPLHWDLALVHIAAVVIDWFTANTLQLLELPPYWSDLAPADFFLPWRVKEELAGLSLDQQRLRTPWKGSPGALPTRSLPPPFSSGMSTAKSGFASAADTWRNPKK